MLLADDPDQDLGLRPKLDTPRNLRGLAAAGHSAEHLLRFFDDLLLVLGRIDRYPIHHAAGRRSAVDQDQPRTETLGESIGNTCGLSALLGIVNAADDAGLGRRLGRDQLLALHQLIEHQEPSVRPRGHAENGVGGARLRIRQWPDRY